MRKLRTVEMLRAVAALLVVLYHTTVIFDQRAGYVPFGDVFASGFRGVDLFFVISGFIITHVHGRDLGRPKRLGPYLYSRAVRILPALWIVTLLAMAVYALGLGVADKGKISWQSIAAGFLLLPQQQEPILNVSWTLKLEAFFYLVFALGILHRTAGVLAFAVWQVLIVVHNATPAGIVSGTPAYYLYAPCLDFSVGVASAWLLSTNRLDRVLRGAAARWSAVSAAVLLFAAGMSFGWTFPWGGILCGAGAGLALSALCLLERDRQIAVPGPLVRLGGHSYAIYLVHFSVITLGVVAAVRLHLPVNPGTCLALAALSVAVGIAFDRLVDRPLQRRLRPGPANGAAQGGDPLGTRVVPGRGGLATWIGARPGPAARALTARPARKDGLS